MAFAAITFQSALLHRPVSVTLLLPENMRPKGILYMLHGFSDGAMSYVRSSVLERCCVGLPLTVVMPDAQCSFYLDTAYGQPYWKHISKEIPEMLKKWLAVEKPVQCFVGGISMGGYGAAKFALQKPECFRKAYIISPVADFVSVSQNGFDRTLDADAPPREDLHMDALLGGRNPAGTSDDLFYLVECADVKRLPEFSIYTGTEDFMYKDIFSFYQALKARGANCSFTESPGKHTWATWDSFLADMVEDIAKRLL